MVRSARLATARAEPVRRLTERPLRRRIASRTHSRTPPAPSALARLDIPGAGRARDVGPDRERPAAADGDVARAQLVDDAGGTEDREAAHPDAENDVLVPSDLPVVR